MLKNSYLRALISRISSINLLFLAGMYVLAYVAVELVVQDPIRHYNFCVFLSLSGIYFSWFIGGRRTMFYVAFFNMFFVVTFSKLLWDQGMIVHSGLFLGRSFLTMYVLTLLLLFLMLLRKSPADVRLEKQKKTIEKAKQHRQNLEFIVASRKLKQDLLAQANMVKDELQLLEGAWKSNIHNIINDLPEVKERELYQQIILPFQENIIRHLRDLGSRLTFDLKPVLLSELFEFLTRKIKNNIKMDACRAEVEVEDQCWQESQKRVTVDKNKVWDIVLNVIRNSQAALELKQIEMLRMGKPRDFQPRIFVTFGQRDSRTELKIIDNGGGASPEHVEKLYREPVPSRKRGGKMPGQGTLFVKFFAERMGISVRAENTRKLGDDGLAVMIQTPLDMTEPSK